MHEIHSFFAKSNSQILNIHANDRKVVIKYYFHTIFLRKVTIFKLLGLFLKRVFN